MQKDGSTGEASELRLFTRAPEGARRFFARVSEGAARPLPVPLAQRDTLGAERSLALVCRALFGETSEQLKVGRFELTATLGRGGMGTAYEALDPLHDQPIALKMLHQQGPLSLYRLKREFRSLAQLRHPNLVRLHELFVERDTAYYTMERVRGTDFVSYVRLGLAPGAPPDEARLRDALAQLCEGVRALHDAGKLHRDLKPANVLVTDTGRVVLLDFGLVHDVHDGSATADGTPAFMAPEQRRGQISQASDWYSVGCMLRDALYGPLAERRESSPGTPLRALASLPLVALCEQLLTVDPERRMAIDPWWVATGALSPTRSHQPPPFTGREAELHSLRAAFERSRTGPSVVLLRGASGIGKTALMNHFAQDTRAARGALVLRGHCYERESVAYNAFDGIVDELTRHLSGLGDEQVLALRPAGCAALVDLFPVLAFVPALSQQTTRVRHELSATRRERALHALKDLLRKLSAQKPVVLCIDDIQWADADSGVLLRSLLRDDDAPALLLIASERIATTGSPQRALLSDAERRGANADGSYIDLTLAGLSSPHAEQLACRLLSAPSTDERVQRIVRDARGSPLLLQALSRWVSRHPRADLTHRMPNLDALLGVRLGELTASEQLILQLVVLAGRPTTLHVIRRAADLDETYDASVSRLRDAFLVHLVQRGREQLLEPDHVSVREAVLSRMDVDTRAKLHLRLGRVLEQTEGVLAEALVEQFVGARLPRIAARHAWRAAEAALSVYAFANASDLYERALALGVFEPHELETLHRELARALEHSGRWFTAVTVCQRAAELLPDPLVAAQFEMRAAQLLMREGLYREGGHRLRRGYTMLGLPYPRSRLSLWGSVLWRMIPRRASPLTSAARPADDALRLARLDLLSGAGRGIEGHDMLLALHNVLLCVEEGEQVSDVRYRARADGLRGFLRCTLLGWGGTSRGLSELAHAYRAAEALDDEVGVIDIQRQLALAYLLAGQPGAALTHADQCESRVRASPWRRDHLDSIMSILGLALLELGSLRELERRWSGFARASRSQSALSRFWIHAHPAHVGIVLAAHDRARMDAMLAEHSQLVARHPRFMLLSWAHVHNSVEAALYWGPGERALELLQRGWRAFARSGYLLLLEEALLLYARASLAAASALVPGRRRTRLLRRASLLAGLLSRRGAQRTHGTLLLVRAAVASLSGRRLDALRELEAASAHCDSLQQKLLAASARYCHGALLDTASGRDACRAAAAVLREEGVVEPTRWVAWSAPGFGALLEQSHDAEAQRLMLGRPRAQATTGGAR